MSGRVPSGSQALSHIYELIHDELDAWSAAGMVARFWWRDDDAVTNTVQLRRLLDIAREAKIIIAVGVIPEHADDSLVELLSHSECCVWQHGWGHHSHTSGEFGEDRALDMLVDNALTGARAMDRLFGVDGWQRVFVPPNHLIAMPFKALVPDLGYLGISAGVQLTPPIDGVMEVNAEIDIMNWYEGKVQTDTVVCEMIVDQLRARRLGEIPTDHPVGILTHHLVFDDAAWILVSQLFTCLDLHPAVDIVRADMLFKQSVPLATAPKNSAPLWRTKFDQDKVGVTVVVTSCGRYDLLQRTLSSFVQHNTYPISDFIVMEDGEAPHSLDEHFRDYNIRWLSTGKRMGQIKAIDAAYRMIKTEYIFHCEDDWEFFAPEFIEKSLVVMSRNPEILQVWIRALADTNNHPVIEDLLFADAVPYRLLRPEFHSAGWGTWHGFSFNPGLRRLRDYHLLPSFGELNPLGEKKAFEVERAASEFYWKRGLLAAILADNHGKGYCRHIGWGRHAEGA